jgi:hypothetical protein
VYGMHLREISELRDLKNDESISARAKDFVAKM